MFGCLVVSAPLGCSLDLEALVADEETDANAVADRPRSDIVVVRFRNLTVREAVNVEFHATSEPLEVLPDNLFQSENLITASVGVAGTGIIQPQNYDIIELPCGTNLTMGTQGGDFLDNESGEPRGRGVARWIQEGPVALCGSVVTFEFAGDGNSFITLVDIRN